MDGIPKVVVAVVVDSALRLSSGAGYVVYELVKAAFPQKK